MPKENKTTEEKNLQKLNKLFSLMDEDTLTKEDFLASFENVVAYVKKMQEQNLQEVEQLKQAFESVSTKLKENNNIDLQDVRTEIKKVFDKVIKDQTDGMNFLRDKTRGFTDGKDGLDADEDIIVDKVLDKIKLPEHKEIILDSPEQFKEKVETIVEELLKELRKTIKGLQFRPMPTGSGATGGGIVKVFDLSDSLDGSIKTFSLPAFWRIISITSSSFPTAFRPTIDYTTDEANSQITFTSEVDVSTMLNTGQSILIVYAEA